MNDNAARLSRRTFLSSLLLAGCGGGEMEEEATVMEPHALPDVARMASFRCPPLRVALFGDRTQIGVNSDGVSTSTVALEFFSRAGANVSIDVHAVGATSIEALTGAAWGDMKDFGCRIAQMPQTVVSLRYGVNDQDADHLVYAVGRMAWEVLDLGRGVIVETPSMVTSPRMAPKVEANAQALREWVEGHNAVRHNPKIVLCDHWRYGEANGFELEADGVNPTAKDLRLRQGKLLASAIWQAARLVKARTGEWACEVGLCRATG